MRILLTIGAFASASAAIGQATGGSIDYAGDARALDKLIVENYAYEDHWPGGALPDSQKLAAERSSVHDRDSLLHYAEDRIASLADHHAITGSSFRDSWAIIPTYADLWIVRRDNSYVIEAVKPGSPAQAAGVRPGDRLIAIGDSGIESAVAGFWDALGLDVTDERADYAARVLAAGRRDRQRELTIARDSTQRHFTLASLYSLQTDLPPLTVTGENGRKVVRINNSLGEQDTIAAFDRAMASVGERTRVVIDLTDTPSGGNSSVARAMISWFIDRPTFYQMHQLPAEERETGIRRQWMEQVVPRAGKHNAHLPIVRVGRWTGSMGEGIAIAFDAIGARVEGDRMAGLKGAVYDLTLPSSGLVVKLPVERLYTVDGRPREAFVPRAKRGDGT
jgi:C-terminal processing protease CtpA/Prc